MEWYWIVALVLVGGWALAAFLMGLVLGDSIQTDDYILIFLFPIGILYSIIILAASLGAYIRERLG